MLSGADTDQKSNLHKIGKYDSKELGGKSGKLSTKSEK